MLLVTLVLSLFVKCLKIRVKSVSSNVLELYERISSKKIKHQL
jgi:hypothetical protein